MNPIIQLQTLYAQLKQKVTIKIDSNFSTMLTFWRRLTVAQRCYLVATLLMLISLFFDFDGNVYSIVMYGFVLAALVNEFWPRFMLVWNSLPGKAFILLTYAIIANFALASASGLVNDVTGVAAHNMPYSHNFAIILMIPGWFILTTLLVLVCVQLLMPVYLILLLLLKPFGIHGLWHAPDYRFVFSTALIRYIWMLILLIKMVEVSTQTGVIGFLADDEPGLAININDGDTDNKSDIEAQNDLSGNGAPGNGTPDNAATDKVEKKATDSDKQEMESVANEVISDVLVELRQEEELNETALGENGLETDLEAHAINFRLSQKKLLANFIFNYEADEHSRCEHAQGSRVIELNDYEILTIVESETSELGYNYEVIPCRSPAIGQLIFPDL